MSSSLTLLLTVGGFAVGVYCGYRLAPKPASPLGLLNPMGWF